MSRLFNTQELHIEVSSKCTLKCPRCPRTELNPDNLNREFSLKEFQQGFSADALSTVNKIIFCGDIGDPIYATEFIEIIAYIKNIKNISISIVTNGSYRKAEWWKQLGQYLTNFDTVIFSVDGWDNESNNKYRINSNWDSIIDGIKTLRRESNCRIKWSVIVFNFNENNLEKIENVAFKIGVDEFQTVLSSKFGGRYLVDGMDPLVPTNPANVAKSLLYEKNTWIVNRPILSLSTMRSSRNHHEWARCLNWEKELFINVDGLLFPCPWFNSGYLDNDFVQKYQSRLNVKTRGLDAVLNDPMWDEFITRIETMPLDVCRVKCRGC